MWKAVASQDRSLEQNEIQSFLEGILSAYVADPLLGCERRAEPRFAATIPVLVCPVDDDLRPQGTSFSAVTNDVSATGIGLTVDRPVESRFVRVELESADKQTCELIVEIRFQATKGKLYHLGGKIVSGARK